VLAISLPLLSFLRRLQLHKRQYLGPPDRQAIKVRPA
jgi:hypothetical protein